MGEGWSQETKICISDIGSQYAKESATWCFRFLPFHDATSRKPAVELLIVHNTELILNTLTFPSFLEASSISSSSKHP